MWHPRRGHAPMFKLKHSDVVSPKTSENVPVKSQKFDKLNLCVLHINILILDQPQN